MRFCIRVMTEAEVSRRGSFEDVARWIWEELKGVPLGPIDRATKRLDVENVLFQVTSVAWGGGYGLSLELEPLATPGGIKLAEDVEREAQDRDVDLTSMFDAELVWDEKFDGIGYGRIIGVSLVRKSAQVINQSPKPGLDFERASNLIELGIPPSYAHVQLCQVERGKYFLGYCRGGTWFYKQDLDGYDMKPVPPEEKVVRWLDLV